MTAKHPAVDYAAMSDAELNYIVAMKGCEIVESHFPNFLELTFQGKSIYTLQKANWAYSRAIQWAQAEGKLPNWARDNNAAAALDFGGHTVQIDLYPHTATVKVLRKDGGIMIYESAANMARAIAEAWLRYMDAMGNSNDT